MIRIAIADDEALIRKGLILLLEDDRSEMKVVLESGDGEDLLHQLEGSPSRPDVLLLDLNMPSLNGVEAARIIQERYPEVKIIVLSTYFSNAFILNMIEAGAAAYLPKNCHPDELRHTILEVMQNGFSYNQKVLEVIRNNLVLRTRPKAPTSFNVELTGRECEVLQLICEENTTDEIAEKLFISPRTVEGHRNNLLEKLGCKNVAGLVVYAVHHQLVRINPATFWSKR